jgi:hypothetical protein
VFHADGTFDERPRVGLAKRTAVEQSWLYLRRARRSAAKRGFAREAAIDRRLVTLANACKPGRDIGHQRRQIANSAGRVSRQATRLGV